MEINNLFLRSDLKLGHNTVVSTTKVLRYAKERQTVVADHRGIRVFRNNYF